MACKTKVLIVDDHAIVQEGITKALEMEEGFEVLSTAVNAQQALKQIKTLKPKEIGTRLFISPKTVETHKYNIMEKLGVDSVTDLTKLAIRNNLIEPYENS